MAARSYFAWRMVAEAAENDRREEERRNLRLRRKLLSALAISDTHFIQRYRLNKEAYKFLCETLRDLTDLRSSQRVSLEIKVLCALLFYANGDYQRVVGMANCYSQEAISRFVHQVTEALNHPNILKTFVKFPTTREGREHVKQSFYNMYGMPGVLGSVDGSHFRIVKPKMEIEHLFYCRKHYHSINVQMVCDHRGQIMSVNPKYGGASHDAFVWENSLVNQYMQTLYQSGESVWLLGDSGYPQRPWLMTPYTHPDPGSAADTYNKVHSSARVIIENTFGRLKNRWRCVCKDRVLHYKPEKCAQIIRACCVLHNLCLQFNVPEAVMEPTGHEAFTRVESTLQEDSSLLTLGRLMRDRVASRVHIVR